jgi:DNA methylase
MKQKAIGTTTLFDRSLFGSNGLLNPMYDATSGVLFKGDCLRILPSIAGGAIDMVFADPPFNLGKEYGRSVNDRRADHEYLEWCEGWIDECIRVLKPGGSLFLYNIPKWNIRLANLLLDRKMQFRDWIAVDIKLGLPIPGRLYPSHYSLLYFTKGKHKTFHNIRVPIKTCRHCGGDVKDYGGHRSTIHPMGVNLTDVWDDIPPVRHWKFKSTKRKANSLSTKLLERVVGMSTDVGDIVLDPFGGSGTTFAVCDKMGRRWIGIEIESAEVIVERLEKKDLHHSKNSDFLEV